MTEISVVLNVFKRPDTLEKQIKAILNQTVKIKPENIHVWYNYAGEKYIQDLPDNLNICTYECNWNTKFHGRFTIPLLLETEFVAMFDDDVLPNKRWFENCLNSMKKQEGIYGSSGVLLNNPTVYAPNIKYGYNAIHNDEIVRVDLVGHGWFFKQEWAKYLWYEKPILRDNGEDIMFSYLAQKHGGINTFVPPHPESNKEIWGSDLQFGHKVGSDEHASWRLGSHLEDRGKIVRECIKNGWNVVASKKKMKDFKEHFYMFLDKLKNNENFAYGRFSDGEMYLLQNRTTKLGDGWYEIDGVRKAGSYDPINYKEVDSKNPDHLFFYDALKDAFKYHAENYYVGLSCRCCVGEENFKWQVDLRGGDDDNLTWSNLLINGNFNMFLNEMLPLFNDKRVVFICNENMDLNKLPFEVVADFRVGNNCMINDFDISDEIIEWMREEDIKDHLFLFSASSLSEVLIHKLHMEEKENTYIDIGTMLNLHLGIDTNRGYLRGGPTLKRDCIW